MKKVIVYSLLGAIALVAGAGIAEMREIYLAEEQTQMDSDYDDPAIAVCEYTKLEGQVFTPDAYNRKAAVVDGLTVHISFTTKPLNTKTQEHHYSCSFKRTGNDFFVLEPILSDQLEVCIEELEVWRNEFKKRWLNAEEKKRFYQKSKECKDIEDDLQTRLEQQKRQSVDLYNMDIYPINEEDTLLGK